VSRIEELAHGIPVFEMHCAAVLKDPANREGAVHIPIYHPPPQRGGGAFVTSVRESARNPYRQPRIPEAHVTRMWLREAVPGARFVTTRGAVARIISVGMRNGQDGPDFLEARIDIDGALRVGPIEIHVHENDWFTHGHGTDPRYRGVILHVVLYGASPPGAVTGIPTVVLADALSRPLRSVWAEVLADEPSASRFACAPYAGLIPTTVSDVAMLLAAAQRLERKQRRVAERLQAWMPALGPEAAASQVLYELLARALGYGGNQDAMESLARALPLHVVSAVSGGRERQALAALRLAAGRDARTSVPGLRQSLRAHGIRPPVVEAHAWRSCRVRSVNRIDTRLAELAASLPGLATGQWVSRLHAALAEAGALHATVLPAVFDFLAPARTEAATGARFREILLNAVAPLFLAYGRQHGEERLCRAASALYHRLFPAPRNAKLDALAAQFTLPSELRGYMQQGLLEMHDTLCVPGLCSECLVGRAMWGPGR
jgi:hypothetical protein